MDQDPFRKNIADVDSEDHLQKARIAAIAGQIHRSLEAWHQLGISRKAAALFSEIDRSISRIQNRNPGLTERIRSFFTEDEDEKADRLISLGDQLHPIQTAVTTYRFRMSGLAAEHQLAIDHFAAFLERLQREVSSRESKDTILPRMIAHGLEYRDAQEQLARMTMLQEAEVAVLESDIAQVILMTNALVKNFAAAEHLLNDGRGILKRYSGA